MKNLADITTAARSNDKPTYEELLYAVVAYDVMLSGFSVEEQPILLQKYFEAGAMDPKEYIGWVNDPGNPEAIEWYQAFINVGEKT